MGTVFSAYDIRGRFEESLTTEGAWNAGKAFAEWLPDEGDVIIMKSATANNAVYHGFVEGLLLQGRNVVDGGVGDQQTVVNALSDPRLAGGALVTHDDIQNLEVITLYDANGVTVTAEKGLIEISQLVDAGNFVPAAEKGELLTNQ